MKEQLTREIEAMINKSNLYVYAWNFCDQEKEPKILDSSFILKEKLITDIVEYLTTNYKITPKHYE